MSQNKLPLDGEKLYLYSQNLMGGLDCEYTNKIFKAGLKEYFNQSNSSLDISDESLIEFATVLYQEANSPENVYKIEALGNILHDLSESTDPISDSLKDRLLKYSHL